MITAQKKTHRFVINVPLGFTLADSLIGVLLFSLTCSGLFHFQRVLLAQYRLSHEKQHYWRTAHHIIESYPAYQAVDIPDGWQVSVTSIADPAGCEQVKVHIVPKQHSDIELTRWFCPSLRQK